METTSLLIGFVAGAIAAAAVTFLALRGNSVSRSEYESVNGRLQVANGALADRDRTVASLEEERSRGAQRLLDLTSEKARLEAELSGLNDRLADQRRDFEELRERSTSEFRNLANQILEEKTSRFTETNKEKMTELLKPLDNDIKEFKARLETIHNQQTTQSAALIENVRNLKDQTDKVTAEANNLATALKSNTKTQGRWGELLLETLLERAGFMKGDHFLVQTVLKNDDGDRQIPDVIINLPDNRCVVVDSKVSLSAYDDFCSAESDEDRDTHLKKHVASIKTHYTDLAARGYENLRNLENSVDFVIMFVPIEPAYILAMKESRDLWDDAYSKKVIIVSPANLFAVIKLVDDLWNRDTQVKNTQKIVDQGRKLYEKFVGFLESLDAVGKKLDEAKSQYDTAVGRLSTGRGNAVRMSEELSKMGGRLSSKKIPVRFLDDDEAEAEALEGGDVPLLASGETEGDSASEESPDTGEAMNSEPSEVEAADEE
jgi:DNA recombination protein RmuC